MSLNLSILYPNGRRKNVKVSPNVVILQTLEDVCKREKLDAETFSFLFQRKILDESLSWRYANVPNNAKLELLKQEKVKQESPVRIALQFEGGNRVQHSFLPSVTLSDILQHWESELSTLTPPEGHEPSILYVRQEITGNFKLSKTTLKSLGLTSGSAILRLSYKLVAENEPIEKPSEKEASLPKAEIPAQQPQKIQERNVLKPPVKSESNEGMMITEEMLQNALEQTYATPESLGVNSARNNDSVESMEVDLSTSSSKTEFFDAVGNSSAESLKNGRARPRRVHSNETAPKKKVKQTPSESPQPDFSEFKFPKESEGMDVYSTENEENEIDVRPLMTPCDREPIFFNEQELQSAEINTDDPGDEFFELTIDDMRKMLSELRYLQNDSEEKPLLTARSREIQRFRSINQYPKIVVRIVFPDQSVLQGIFRPAEPVQSLYDFVSNFISSPATDFYLYTTPPKVILKDKKSILYDNHLVPASKVYFGMKNHDFEPKILSSDIGKCRGTAIEANLKLRSVFELKSPTVSASNSAQEFTKATSQRGHSSSSVPDSETPSTSRQTGSSQTSSNNASGARPKVPKWFKLGKK
ncbi:tether containing UBX domain for GLUT4-like [Styela clava]